MTDIIILVNIILLESILSVDNAVILAAMVKHLPKEQQGKALKYGILGAYILRGLCLLVVSLLLKVLWLKLIGGAYLIYLCYNHFYPKIRNSYGDISQGYGNLTSSFVGTVIMVEFMDLTFSIDNIFGVVAMTDKMYLIIIGVFIGIISMRFISQMFLKLIEKFPTLEDAAYRVIGFLGIKLIFDYLGIGFVNEHYGQIFTSTITTGLILTPIIGTYVRKYILSRYG